MALNIWTFTMKLSMLYGFYVHVYASMVIGSLGALTNLINVIVFSHKKMVSPINIILAGMAITDLLQSIEYIPIVYYVYIGQGRSIFESLLWNPTYTIVFLHMLFGWVNHATTICLTVILFWWRHNALLSPLRNSRWRNKNVAVVAVAVCYLLSVVGVMPLFYCHFWGIDYAFTEQVAIASAITFLICLPFMSFALLMIICIRISGAINAIRPNPPDTQELRVNYHHKATIAKRRGRSKPLLWVILVLFFVNELPTILSTLAVHIMYRDMMSTGIFWELNDMLTLFTASLNFFFYYLMSIEYRDTFHHIFCFSSGEKSEKSSKSDSNHSASSRSSNAIC